MFDKSGYLCYNIREYILKSFEREEYFMNIEFEMGLQLINLGSYEKAVERIRAAVDEETEKNDEKTAAEYRCVLGELLANLGRKEEANAEFAKVVAYCKSTGSLPKQLEIAEKYLSKVTVKKAAAPKKTPVKKKKTSEK